MHRTRAAVLLSAVLSLAVPSSGDASAQLGVPASQAPAAGACPAIPLAGADARAVRTPSAVDAWGGARTGTEATLSDRVVAYSIDAELDPVKHTIKGRQALTWRNRSAQPVCSVYLHLYLNGFEGPGSTWMTEQRASAGGFRTGVDTKDGEFGHIRLDKVAQAGVAAKWTFVQPDGGPATDRSVVRIDLPRPVAAGASTTLDIDFFDQLPRVVARTGYYGTFHLVGQWFPKIGVLELPGERGATAPRWNAHEFHLHSEFYADFGSYDVRITVPKGYTVGATGVASGAPVEKNGKVTHRYVQDDVHDFAWTADKRYAKPMAKTWAGPNGPVEVKVLYHPEYASNAEPVLQATIDSLEYFSDTLGGYPYRSVTAVIPPHGADEAGGMEYPTFFTADSTAQVAPGTAGRYALDFVTVHEFGHGYFMGILASNEFEEPYLDEGMNEYWDQRMMTARKQDIVLTAPWLKPYGIGTRIAPFQMERLAASLGDPADPLGSNAWERLSSGSYTTVYTRTATAMRQIESLVGTQAMERAMKLYYARWKFRHPSTADLQAALAEGTGRPDIVDAVFDGFIYGTGKVDDRIASIESREVLPLPGYRTYKGQQVLVGGKQIDKAVENLREKWKKAHPDAKEWQGAFPWRSTVVVRRDGIAVPQVLRVKFADGSQRDVAVTSTGSWQRFAFVGPAKAVSAQLDPDDKVHLDTDELNDSRTLEANGDAARRWFRDFAMLLQSLFALLATI